MIRTTYRLVCDDCERVYAPHPPLPHADGHELRQRAAFEGWTHGKRDRCAQCHGYSGETILHKAIKRWLRWREIVEGLRARPNGVRLYEAVGAGHPHLWLAEGEVRTLERLGVVRCGEVLSRVVVLCPEEEWRPWVRTVLGPTPEDILGPEARALLRAESPVLKP